MTREATAPGRPDVLFPNAMNQDIDEQGFNYAPGNAEKLALELLQACRSGAAWRESQLDRLIAWALDEETSLESSRALFGVIAEGLADSFEPRLCDDYARMFARVIEGAYPDYPAKVLYQRYQRVRGPRTFSAKRDVRAVYVLSRISLGADIAITSTILDGMKRRFPRADILFVGPGKNWALFAHDPRVRHVPVSYVGDGGLTGRLAVWPNLRSILDGADSIVVDPDSRLTQLGLLPVCPEENYYFFESRAYGQSSRDSLYQLTARWLRETFGIEQARPYICVGESAAAVDEPIVSVSFGVGHNEEKRIPDPFEEGLLRRLTAFDAAIYVDAGAGRDEEARVQRAAQRVGGSRLTICRGTFAAFAQIISRSWLYVGYDSAGQHVATVSGVPFVSVFAGFVSSRMFDRWSPAGTGRVLKVTDRDPEKVLQQVNQALKSVAPP